MNMRLADGGIFRGLQAQPGGVAGHVRGEGHSEAALARAPGM
jgi:hypothetical protein